MARTIIMGFQEIGTANSRRTYFSGIGTTYESTVLLNHVFNGSFNEEDGRI